MKYFIVRNNVISRILKLLKSRHKHMHIGAIKFIRAILSVKDEFYHKHIVKYDILRPIFELFEKIYMKDSLISSAIVEIIDFIRTERIVSLICYIVEKYRHLFALCMGDVTIHEGSSHSGKAAGKLLYVELFQKFLHTYEQVTDPAPQSNDLSNSPNIGQLPKNGDNEIGNVRKKLNRNLAEIDSEEAYFLDDNDENEGSAQDKSWDEDEYGPFLPKNPTLQTLSGLNNNEQKGNKSVIQKRSYFDDLDDMSNVRGNPVSTLTSTKEGTVNRNNSNSLELISELYSDNGEDDTSAERNGGLEKQNARNEYNGQSRSSFCYSPPPPNLPPLRSKFEQDNDEEVNSNSGNPFFQSKILTATQAGRKVSRVESRLTEKSAASESVASGGLGSGGGGGVRFSMKKKSRYF
mmetsp:Transcript_23909/g.40673  ORF Transcript_23909/g.40673 Transcript_23909/m.40673 type:complete len:406 (+) Transcript_23909:3-1220(+)